MEIKYKDIILRDMVASDIDDWIRWYNEDTQWSDWDAPDEPVESVDPNKYREEIAKKLKVPLKGFRNSFEIDTADGDHIGNVTSYAVNDSYEWIFWQEARESGNFIPTIGIDICDSRFWGRGLGTQALTAFIHHYLDAGFLEICLQTWSGNARMIRCAQKIGFTECSRIVGNRLIRGSSYDSLTFKLDLTKFHNFLLENA